MSSIPYTYILTLVGSSSIILLELHQTGCFTSFLFSSCLLLLQLRYFHISPFQGHLTSYRVVGWGETEGGLAD